MDFKLENHTHHCEECGMKFYNSQQLVNHVRKFCSGAGLNSLEGIAQYQMATNFSKKVKNDGASSSLGAMKYEPTFSPSELARDAKQVARQKQQIYVNRQYSNINANNNNQNSYLDSRGFQNSIVQKFNIPLQENRRAGFGQRVLAGSEISINSLRNFGQQQSNKERIQKRTNQSYVSPPTQIPLVFAKGRGTSLLDKSNSSIANMSQSRKKDYANQKLIQLFNIEQMYEKNGGINLDFRKNLDKMKKFYKKMLQDDKPTNNYPGQMIMSRPQTPITQLHELMDQEQNFPNKSRAPKDALEVQMMKSNKKKNQMSPKNSPMRGFGPEPNGNSKLSPSQLPQYQHPHLYYPQYPPQQQQQPQIIMLPPYPQQQQTQQPINDQVKYYEKMIELKNQENQKLMKMILQTKKQKNFEKAKSKVEKIRHSRTEQIFQQNSNNYGGGYHMQSPMMSNLSPDEKILLALQRQELDELRLLSLLPPELQQIKMQSVLKLIEQRAQLQKQILEQKVFRLEEQQKNQLYEENMRLKKDEWANHERKKLIGFQLDDVLEKFKNKVKGEESEDSENDEGEGEGQSQGQQELGSGQQEHE